MAAILADVAPEPYPARSKAVVEVIQGIETHVNGTLFGDKILLTVVQNGRIPLWINVSLPKNVVESDESYLYQDDEDEEVDPLSMPNIDSSILMGGAKEEIQISARALASQVALLLLKRNPKESRSVVLGIGLAKQVTSKEDFDQLLGLITGVI